MLVTKNRKKLTKRWEKVIRQLQTKKYRKNNQQFFVEGSKMVVEALNSDYEIEVVFYTEQFFERYRHRLESLKCPAFVTEEKVLRQLGNLQTNDGALAVVNIPQEQEIDPNAKFTLVLDDIRDPGNLGTILRIADWFAISQLVCSESSVDLYNPKVVAASMGSIFRANCIYTDITAFLKDKTNAKASYGAFMEGEDFHSVTPNVPFVLVMGNESNGINPTTAAFISHKITIPKYGKAESLNVAMATGILCNFFKMKIN